ncbi:TPA_asm: hypothetical protein GEA50_08545, partial [Campylobacter jejuni]|nr:hypothetical protein [Campylobacter jejuni]
MNKKINISLNAFEIYGNVYNSDKNDFNIIPVFSEFYKNNKMLHLICCKHCIFITRDPISIIKHGVNHVNNEVVTKMIVSNKNINLSYMKLEFAKPYYYNDKHYPSINILDNVVMYHAIYPNGVYFKTQKRLNILKKYNKIENIECLEMADINKENAFNTFTRLAKKYGFTPPNDPIPFQGRVNR